jgi:putative zinc finger protein
MTDHGRESFSMSDEPARRHLEVGEVAAYVDDSLDVDVRRRVESHVSICADCRSEIADVARVVVTLPSRRVSRGVLTVASAAAAVVLLALPWTRLGRTRPEHREAAVTTTVAPRLIAPRGAVASAKAFVWSSVPYADGYRVRVFDSTGTVIWESERADTAAPLPARIVLRAARPYYWKVEARTGFDRWVASELLEFTVSRGSEP